MPLISPSSSPARLSEEIDRLFEHYLHLLHQYHTLRAELSTLQSSVQQNLARANFDARGIRYGADLYDERMQASRTCRVTISSEDTSTSTSTGTGTGTGTAAAAVFTISTAGAQEGGDPRRSADSDVSEDLKNADPPPVHVQHENGRENRNANENGHTGVGEQQHKQEKKKQQQQQQAGHDRQAEETPEEGEGGGEQGQKGKGNSNPPKDPIRMFGILVPQTLRAAQTHSVALVRDILPALASVDAEMKEVEIQIRRVRKWRGKAEGEGKRGLGVELGVVA